MNVISDCLIIMLRIPHQFVTAILFITSENNFNIGLDWCYIFFTKNIFVSHSKGMFRANVLVLIFFIEH